jgi:hypothetical protein
LIGLQTVLRYKHRLFPNEAVKPSLSLVHSALLLIAYPPHHCPPRSTMLTGGLRGSIRSHSTRFQGLGIAVQVPVPSDNGPSTSRNVISRPPISWGSLRKGKQRASLDLDSQSSLFSTLRRSTDMSLVSHGRVQVRHFHVSRPRHALPLIPATAAILKVNHHTS